ncbi:2-oxo-4-hydroxy-4-carboxy-5-ureidoimidazoline decarboxylase [Edaphobacter aggregans]|uniref:2-oxo-4-hydroxy-4-carboxy-5-ureidoimidazoline decarboxylase n=1 Tax=Edaphobacter aggregans TaxID=570835 RepID=UPI000AE5750F|nr:2-oxo-4-hydroxy-4-carboxy-5-ureidoimidazoline decarboxylase [Edaphobacter aggregans]
MRSLPSNYELVAPGSLASVLALLAREPGWTPVAGGTEVMVQYGAGKLAAQRLVSIWGIPELRRIETIADELHIGAGCTYTDLRRDSVITSEFPLLSTAASWTGSIANQNRGTLGGNIVNASPAADSLPALLAYEAELILTSARGERRVPYGDFHTGYKQTLLSPDELIRTIVLKRRFAQYVGYARKVGTRSAQAISKLCMAGLAKTSGKSIDDVRISIASMAPIPLRLRATEQVLLEREWSIETLRAARRALESEVSPIDDIRSTRAYRVAVAGNLLEEFLYTLFPRDGAIDQRLNQVLERWNALPFEDAATEILSCCGSYAWAKKVTAARPFSDTEALLQSASAVWRSMQPEEWMEAFRSHPRIGERHAEVETTAVSQAWSAGEQTAVHTADAEIRRAIAEGNRRYEERFARIFLVCASGKQPQEILKILERRLTNDDDTELHESAAEQEQILRLRLRRWLGDQEGM